MFSKKTGKLLKNNATFLIVVSLFRYRNHINLLKFTCRLLHNMRRLLLALLVSLAFASYKNPFAPKCLEESDCKLGNNCDHDLGICIHKDLMPLNGPEIVGSILIFLMSALSNAGGIGGSSIMIAFMLLIFTFETHMAIPIVQIIILSGSIVAVILKVKVKHPDRNRPLIVWDLLMLEVAPLLLGSFIGVFLNIGFPTWLILAILIVVTLFLTYLTFKKGLEIYRKETKLKKAQAQAKSLGADTDGLENIRKDQNSDEDEKSIILSEPSKLIIVDAETREPIKKIDLELIKLYDNEKRAVSWQLLCICIIFA